MAGVAIDHYDPAGFWPKLATLVEMPADQTFQQEWGSAFLANLSRLGLPSFEHNSDTGSRYVGRVLMHAGIPTYCLADYVTLLQERRRIMPGLEPAEFVSWVATRAAAGQLPHVDRPVLRFLQHGGDFAADVVDRSFDLCDVIAGGADGSDVPLPARFAAAVVALRDAGALSQVRRGAAHTGAGTAARQPHVVIDPFGQGVLLRLPAVGEAPDGRASWVVTLDETTRTVGTQALEQGSGEPAPQTDVAIPGPVRAITAALAGHEHLRSQLQLVDSASPLLAFAEDGPVLPAGVPLPPECVWLLLPGAPDALRIVGDAPVITESPLPPGWAGWCLLLVDVSAARQIGLSDVGQLRSVRGTARARVVLGDPLTGVRTAVGAPIYPHRPSIELPGDLGEVEWDLAVLDAEGELLARWQGQGTHGDAELWSQIPAPMLGTYTVRVRGPWGRGATRTVTVVEGLSVAFSPAWRRFAPDGLVPATATVTGPRELDVSRSTVELGARQRDTYLRVGVGGAWRTIVVTPPHMSVSHQSESSVSQPSILPASLFSESVQEDPGALVLHLQQSGAPTLHLRTAAGVVQTVEPGAERAGSYRFSLEKIVGTLASHPKVELCLDAVGDLVVGRIRPRRLFTGARVEERELVFEECVDVDGLTALVYACRAPWRAAVTLSIQHGRAALPEDLVDVGPLRVMVRLEDPWAPAPIPDWPEPRQSMLVDAEARGFLADAEDAPATAISKFLAGAAFPEEIEDVGLLWTVRGLVGSLGLGDDSVRVRTRIDEFLHAHPREALLALNGSKAPTEAMAELLIATGIVWSDLAEAHDDAAPEWSHREALPAALLSAADGVWSNDEIEAATVVCGDVVRPLLEGSDPYAKAGRLDESAELLADNPVIREAMVRAAGLVPQGLLVGDTRVIAAMDFVEARHDGHLEWLRRQGHKILPVAERLLASLGGASLAAFAARRHPSAGGGWRVIPSLSLAFALAARHAARGSAPARTWVERCARPWADLAHAAPDLVVTDLLLAELIVASGTGAVSPRTSALNTHQEDS